MKIINETGYYYELYTLVKLKKDVTIIANELRCLAGTCGTITRRDDSNDDPLGDNTMYTVEIEIDGDGYAYVRVPGRDIDMFNDKISPKFNLGDTVCYENRLCVIKAICIDNILPRHIMFYLIMIMKN